MESHLPLPAGTGQAQKPQAPLSSGSILSPETLRTNSAALRAFPSNSQRALLYAEGPNLFYPQGLAWVKNYALRQNLDLLQTTIQQTFDAVLTPCQTALESRQTLSSEKTNTIREHLREAGEMLVGLERLCESLKWQYSDYAKDSAEQAAIARLSSAHLTLSTQIQADQRRLESIVEPPAATQVGKSATPAVQDNEVARLVRVLEKKTTQVDNRSLLTYVSTNEDGMEEVEVKLMRMPPHDGHGGHIGFSSTHNFDIMCARKSGFGLICDFNPDNAKFIKVILEKLRTQPNITRERFVDQMRDYINKQTEDVLEKRPGAISFSWNFSLDGIDPASELIEMMERSGGWLSSNENFNFIKRLAMEGKIGTITIDITDNKTFTSISNLIKENGFSIDSLYLTNICDYMSTKEKAQAYNTTITTLAGPHTYVIDCVEPVSASDLGPRQRLVQGGQAAQLPPKWRSHA